MVIEQRIIFICSLVIFMSLPTLSRIYFVRFRQNAESSHKSNEINLLRQENKGYQSRSFIEQLISILTHNRTETLPTTKKKCVAQFGSMYGPHGNRHRCLESSKTKPKMSSLLSNDYIYEEFHQWHYEPYHYDDVMYYEHEYPFFDFTKNERALSYDTRSTNEDLKSESPMAVLLLTNYRRSPQVGITKRNMNVRATESRDDEDDETDDSDTTSEGSDDEDSFTETDVRSMKQKPKRFQVIDNEQAISKPIKITVVSEKNLESTHTDGELADSNVYKTRMKRKRIVKRKKANKPLTDKKELYLQGNRFIDPNAESDLRKSLQSFLPKRYHWREDEIHDLGYYWFNGPQGRYPLYVVRP